MPRSPVFVSLHDDGPTHETTDGHGDGAGIAVLMNVPDVVVTPPEQQEDQEGEHRSRRMEPRPLGDRNPVDHDALELFALRPRTLTPLGHDVDSTATRVEREREALGRALIAAYDRTKLRRDHQDARHLGGHARHASLSGRSDSSDPDSIGVESEEPRRQGRPTGLSPSTRDGGAHDRNRYDREESPRKRDERSLETRESISAGASRLEARIGLVLARQEPLVEGKIQMRADAAHRPLQIRTHRAVGQRQHMLGATRIGFDQPIEVAPAHRHADDVLRARALRVESRMSIHPETRSDDGRQIPLHENEERVREASRDLGHVLRMGRRFLEPVGRPTPVGDLVHDPPEESVVVRLPLIE